MTLDIREIRYDYINGKEG